MPRASGADKASSGRKAGAAKRADPEKRASTGTGRKPSSTKTSRSSASNTSGTRAKTGTTRAKAGTTRTKAAKTATPSARRSAPASARPREEARAPRTVRLKLTGVAKRYRIGELTVNALEDVDLEIPERSFVVILGPSGSGKTTLLNIIGALDTPTTGTVQVAGHDISSASRRQRTAVRRSAVGFIFQTFNLFPGLTALENVEFGADVAGRAKPRELAVRVLGQVGLDERLGHFPHQLSGGEQQRVAIARALATENPVLLADEPTGELDFRTGVQILELLLEQAEAGRTVLVVTHNREISRIADRVVELSSGRIVQDGPPEGGKADVSELRW